jgi:hypothetical protein
MPFLKEIGLGSLWYFAKFIVKERWILEVKEGESWLSSLIKKFNIILVEWTFINSQHTPNSIQTNKSPSECVKEKPGWSQLLLTTGS